MTGPSLSSAEKLLLQAASDGNSVTFRRRVTIRAEIVRCLALGLPIGGRTYGAPAGISVENAIIDGRLQLDGCTTVGGEPLCAMTFIKCRFDGGFSGKYAHFRHLSFRDSTFRNPPVDADGSPAPSIDLSSATIGSDLLLARIAPDRTGSEGDYLWVAATGIAISGMLNLNGACLVSPANFEALKPNPTRDALSLALSQIRGDIRFMDAALARGRFDLRSAEIEGDLWLSGSTIENPGHDAFRAQAARIKGNLMLAEPEPADGTGSARPVRIKGTLAMHSVEVGGSLYIELSPEPEWSPDEIHLPFARVGPVLNIYSSNGDALVGGLCLLGASIQGNVIASRVYSKATGAANRSPYSWDFTGLKCKLLQLSEWGSGPKNPGESNRPAGGFQNWERRFLPLRLIGARMEVQEVRIDRARLLGVLQLDGIRCETDVAISGQVRQLHLRDATIGNSLDIADLRLIDTGTVLQEADLNLFDAKIGRAIRVVPETHATGRLGVERLLTKARTVSLESLPDTELVETLWIERHPNGGISRKVQAGFLYTGYKPIPLDGSSETIHGFVGKHSHCINSKAVAEEYLRLFCRYLQADDGAFLIIDPKSDGSPRLPPFVTTKAPDIAAPNDEARNQLQAARDVLSKTVVRHLTGEASAAELAAAKGEAERLAALATPPRIQINSIKITPVQVEDDAAVPGRYKGVATVLYGGVLFRSAFSIGAEGRHSVQIEMLQDEPISPELAGVPEFAGSITRHPKSHSASDKWVTEPTLAGMIEVGEARRKFFELLLCPLLDQAIHSNAVVDLTDCDCDTLEDDAGRGWGDPREIRMNHFQYSKTSLARGKAPADEESPIAALTQRMKTKGEPKLRHWFRPFRKQRKEKSAPSLSVSKRLQFAVLRRLPRWMLSEALRRNLIQHEEATSGGWRARRNWIYRQYTDRYDYPSIERYRIRDRRNYAPQPFEQAIKVARLEGRRNDAVEFAILKRSLEWAMFSRQWRFTAACAGAVTGLLWSVRAGAGFGSVFASTVVGLVAGSLVSGTLDRFLRRGFGYTLKPVNAAFTLLLLFVIGVIGVESASRNKMLVVDMSPVAGTASRTGQLGTPIADGQVASGLPCSGISEPLYALDLLIPLVDLRQEEKCEIRNDSPAPEAGSESPSDSGPLERLARTMETHTTGAPSFWSAMKSIYAILGWIVVSLTIVTLANVMRSGTGQG